MRKKSHIALAVFLNAGTRLEEMDRYRKEFYFGSIQPDLNPRMFSEPHEFDESWERIKKLICQIVSEVKEKEYSRYAVWTQAGVVIHYLADYFTFPHNTCYEGSLKGHCKHENELKYLMRAYLYTAEAKDVFETQELRARQIRTPEQLFSYVERMHQVYMSQKDHSALNDCRWITEICSCSQLALAGMICQERMPEIWPQGCVA
ncbi:MAG: zinc dependent phospholipase C family protein [Clostridiales bacterium]|nr:zinc dependent phospholipase C family protein [Clostridiales bacterium]